MAFEAKATGKKYGSKFRANRADKAAQEGMESAPEVKGNRAEANEIEAKGKKSPVMPTGAGDDGGPVNASAADTMKAKAREVHITHNHETGMHHVHTVMEDGTEEHTDHPSPEEAHFHGAMAAGANEGNYPAEHESAMAKGEPDEDDYQVEEL